MQIDMKQTMTKEEILEKFEDYYAFKKIVMKQQKMKDSKHEEEYQKSISLLEDELVECTALENMFGLIIKEEMLDKVKEIADLSNKKKHEYEVKLF